MAPVDILLTRMPWVVCKKFMFTKELKRAAVATFDIFHLHRGISHFLLFFLFFLNRDGKPLPLYQRQRANTTKPNMQNAGQNQPLEVKKRPIQNPLYRPWVLTSH